MVGEEYGPGNAAAQSNAATMQRAAAADLLKVAQDKAAAANYSDTDTFTENASSPEWTGGFDELLGTKRTVQAD